MRLLTLVAACAVLVLASCRHGANGTMQSTDGDTITHHAKWLTMVEGDDSVIAYIRSPWKPDARPARLAFAKNGAMQRTVVYSSVYANAIKELGAIGTVKGVADAQYFKIPEIKKGLKDGSVADVGNSQNPSVEAIVALQPEAILVSPYQNSDFGALRRLGVPVVEMMDYMEETPLGRAEWIKLLGAMFGQRQLADSIFRQVEANYNGLKKLAAKTTTRPTVISETPYAGVWYVPGGQSYMARMYADAAAKYPWADTKDNGSIPLNFEAVFSKASNADVWLLKTLGPTTLKSLRTDNPLLQRFKTFAPGKIWVVNTEASDFYETFPFHPDLLLKDYIAVFHPETGLAPRWFAPLME